MIRLASIAALVACLALASTARAQLTRPSGAPSESDRTEARERYEAGLAHVQAGRWADALTAFSAAYRLSGVGAALFNAATALRALGRNVEARDALDRLLTEHDDLDDSVRVVAAQMRDEVTARIAVLELVGIPGTAGDLAIRLDAAAVADTGARPLEVEADPGYRRLTVESPTEGRFAWEGHLDEGQRLPVEVDLEKESDGIPWWAVAGGGALVAVGVVVLIAVLSTPDDPQVNAEVFVD